LSKHKQSSRKGKAVEHLVAAISVLATAGELNALTALVDDEGVDVSFKRHNGIRTLDVQVKARFSDEGGSKALREQERFTALVGDKTFRVRDDLYLLYVAIDGARGAVDMAWLVPSAALEAEGMSVTINGQRKLKFAASAKEAANDKWRKYRLGPEEWPARLLQVVEDLEPACRVSA
jgi:hypothetical protein